jgi:TDG/mug DNA glycosylase family protein
MVIPDVIAPDLDALFVGINPGLVSARERCHFANPSNGFWRLLHESGFTRHRFAPSEQRDLLKARLGITNVVARESAGVADLSRDDFERGRRALARKIRRYRPRAIVFVGIMSYRAFSGEGTIACGEQKPIDGARVFVVPNPSGRNAHFRYEDMLTHFRHARDALRDP